MSSLSKMKKNELENELRERGITPKGSVLELREALKAARLGKGMSQIEQFYREMSSVYNSPFLINDFDESRSHVLFETSAYFGDIGYIERCLRLGIKFGDSLYYAFIKGHKKIVDVLIKAGADPKLLSERQKTIIKLNHPNEIFPF
jgi:hypothetical protein